MSTKIFGSSESFTFYKKYPDKWECWSYRVDYDRNMKEIGRTEPRHISTIIGCTDVIAASEAN